MVIHLIKIVYEYIDEGEDVDKTVLCAGLYIEDPNIRCDPKRVINDIRSINKKIATYKKISLINLSNKEYEKLNKNLRGIRDMKKAPEAMIIVDPRKEEIAIKEARILGIPVFGVVDTNGDPDDVDYVIPANDDAIRSVKLIVATLANAVVEANGGTPIEIVFTDEPVAEEPRARRDREYKGNNKERRPRPNKDNRANKPYRINKEGQAQEAPKAEEVKAEAPAQAE